MRPLAPTSGPDPWTILQIVLVVALIAGVASGVWTALTWLIRVLREQYRRQRRIHAAKRAVQRQLTELAVLTSPGIMPTGAASIAELILLVEHREECASEPLDAVRSRLNDSRDKLMRRKDTFGKVPTRLWWRYPRYAESHNRLVALDALLAGDIASAWQLHDELATRLDNG